MYLPRNLISHLYQHLVRTHHSLSPPVLLLVALEPDALCACRILQALLKRDYIPHKIQPISGYGDLARAGETLVQSMRTQQGGSGGVVVCLGVGGLVDLATILGFDVSEADDDGAGGVEVWLIDARRPWNLGNVFGGRPTEDILGEVDANARHKDLGIDRGQLLPTYRPGKGGVIVYDDGDIIEEMDKEREAYCTLEGMPNLEDDGEESDESSDDGVAASDTETQNKKKRKSWSDREEDGEDEGSDDDRPRQRRRSNSSDSIHASPSRPAPRGLLSTSIHNNDTIRDRSRSLSPSAQPSAPPLPKQPSPRTLRRRLLRLRRKHEAVLTKYYSLGASYSEPISSILYSLAAELAREDNDLLWHAIVGVSSFELYGRSMTGVGIISVSGSGGSAGWGGERGETICQVLRDEVRRLNPPDPNDTSGDMARGEAWGVIPTTARSPTDTSIRLSPEPRFLLIRHWSLYDSMLHSPYLSARLHIWSDAGRKRLHKLLAKMGVSLTQCKQSYTHMDMDLKRGLRQRLLKYAPLYGLDGLVPPSASAGRGQKGWGFVRSYGWKACLSATDVGVIVGSILEVGKSGLHVNEHDGHWDRGRTEKRELVDEQGEAESEEWVRRFWEAYDALGNVDALKHALPTAQHLYRAILRTGTSLIEKRQIRHLRAFRMTVVKEGPDVTLFTHPAALTKLALWVGEAIAEQEREQRGKVGKGGRGTPLVMAALNEARGVYVVVGTGGGAGGLDIVAKRERETKRAKRAKEKERKEGARERKRKEREERMADGGEEEEDEEEEEESEDDGDEEDEDDGDGDGDDEAGGKGFGKNRFGSAFQEVVDETKARVRIDSFENCVVEVKKEDLSGFLESLSMRTVVG